MTAILDADVTARAGWTVVDLAKACLNGGARLLQVRAKNASGASFLDLTFAVVALAREAGAVVIVNDRADIAKLTGADGVHGGQHDLPPAALRAIVGTGAIVGLSTHTLEQLDAAVEQPVNYLAAGPVFATTTKATGYASIGLAMVREASRRATVRGLPLVAIGGITLERARSVIEAGAASIAVIKDLLATGDPERQTRAFLDRIGSRLHEPDE